MAFRLIDGKLAKVDGKFSFRENNSVTLVVSDLGFPITNYPTVSSLFEVQSSKPIVMTLRTNEEVFVFSSSNKIGASYILKIGKGQGIIAGTYVPVNFINSSGANKTITLEFLSIGSIHHIGFDYFNIIGGAPDIRSMFNLRSLTFSQNDFISSFPSDISNLSILESIRFSNIGPKQNKIPDSFFYLPIKKFYGHNTFNLSDPISSNAFKINNWNQLQELDLSSCNLSNYFPNDWSSFANTLQYLRINGNSYDHLPSILTQFTEIRQFHFRVINQQRQPWGNLQNWGKLRDLIEIGSMEINNLSNDWKYLVSLLTIGTFNAFIVQDSDFDIFVNQCYTLCTTNGSITNNSGQFATYPNRFRNIAWGHASLSFTGAKVAPTGYVQGVSNGTPANEGEKVYVLQNQYGHVITHA